MAKKRRNHEIPRLLLNRFASWSQGDKRWIYRTGRAGKPRKLSTKDAAVGSFFYGRPETGVEDALQKIESKIAPVLDSLDNAIPPRVHADELRQFVYIVLLRTRAFREGFTANCTDAFNEFFKPRSFNRQADEYIDANFDALLTGYVPESASESRGLQIRRSDPALRHVAKAQLHHLLRSPEISSQIRSAKKVVKSRLPGSLRDGQIEGLQRLLEQHSVPDTFSPQSWAVSRFPKNRVLLGDCCALAISEDGKYGSFFKFPDRWATVFLPISSEAVLVAARGKEPPAIDVDVMNKASAAFSHRYIYSSHGNTEVVRLARLIGTGDAFGAKAALGIA